jgi:heme a synthase
LNSEALAHANEVRIWKLELEPINFFQLGVHLLHRLGAVLIGIGVWFLIKAIWKQASSSGLLRKFAILLACLVVIQFVLGMAVIWSSKAADIATAHVAIGALTFMVSVLIVLACYKLLAHETKSALMDASALAT